MTTPDFVMWRALWLGCYYPTPSLLRPTFSPLPHLPYLPHFLPDTPSLLRPTFSGGNHCLTDSCPLLPHTRCRKRPLPQVFCNARANYHVTVFHTSYPSDQRPSPLLPGGGAAAAGDAPRSPTAEELSAEADAVARIVSETACARLVLDRVVMATSGTLLLTWWVTYGTA